MERYEVVSNGPDETAAVARALASVLRGGDVILLDGQLAAGKTTFVKAVASARGSSDIVTSPTFTLANFYSTPTDTILHIDAYRLSGLLEFRDLALDDYFDSALTFIEWGMFAAKEFPEHLAIQFSAELGGADLGGADLGGAVRRTLTFSSDSLRWIAVLPAVLAEMATALGKATA
jgi:tRNA threonylcarbamoyladenosine biosynthesis protein TsaE